MLSIDEIVSTTTRGHIVIYREASLSPMIDKSLAPDVVGRHTEGRYLAGFSSGLKTGAVGNTKCGHGKSLLTLREASVVLNLVLS
jgi:hypothetical protein